MISKIKYSFIFLLAFTFISCSEAEPSMTSEEFVANIKSAERVNIETGTLVTGLYETVDSENNFERIFTLESEVYSINPRPIVLPDNFLTSKKSINHLNTEMIVISLDKEGTLAWSEATKINLGKKLVFILDDNILSASLVQSQITNGGIALWKDFLSKEQWYRLNDLLKK